MCMRFLLLLITNVLFSASFSAVAAPATLAPPDVPDTYEVNATWKMMQIDVPALAPSGKQGASLGGKKPS
jgi:hypothetical protein